MSNCNNLFQQFNQAISPGSARIDKLTASREALKNKIIQSFKEKPGYKVPDFYIQGSYKMDTMIVKKDGTYDVDLGIYFKEKPMVTCTTVMTHVIDAVRNHTTGGAQHRERCIRVIYAGEYNIDLPVYFQGPYESKAKMAIKNGDWRTDDPEEFVLWFNKRKDTKGQLLRIVKYLKRWASERGFKMPSGVALTVWAAEKFYASDGRDDFALYPSGEPHPLGFSGPGSPRLPFEEKLI